MTQQQGGESAAAVAYAAKSTEDKHGSIPDQLADCRWLADQEGAEVVAEYRDESFRAFKQSRGPGLAAAQAKAEELARERGACLLLIQHSDRLARGDVKQAAHLIEYAIWAIKSDVRLLSVQDPKTFGDLLYTVVTGQRNYEDSARKAQATRDGLRRRKERGEPVGPVPLGYTAETTLVDGQPVTSRVIDPTAATVIKDMFAALDRGSSFGEVARSLNAAGVPSSRGTAWWPATVRRLAQNRAYMGERGYPAIIKPARWQRVHDGRRHLDPAAVQRRGPRRQVDDSYFLRGVGFCLACGAPLYTRRLAAGRMYTCRHRRECTGLCPAPAIPADLLEEHVLRQLDVFIGSVEDWMAEHSDEHGENSQAHEAAVKRKRRRLADLDRTRERHLVQYRKLVEEGSDDLARIALEEVQRIDSERERQRHVPRDFKAVADEWAGPPDVSEALDFYNRLVEFVHREVNPASGAVELHRALYQVLAGVWASIDGETLHAQFELRVAGEGHSAKLANGPGVQLRGRRPI
jgi:DNA invertase Pin-like site-specific DNA recombinase